MADQKRSRQDIFPDGRFPGDVMVSILINLPVKSLLKFKAVSKSWCCLISSNHFFKLHLHRQSIVAPNNCLLSLRDVAEDEDEDEFHLEFLDVQLGVLDLTDHYHSSPDDDSPAADDDVLMLGNGFPPFHLSLLASCNGLLCIEGSFKTSYDVILWNPATRTHKYLGDVSEEDDLDFRTLGLCYVDDTNDFKVLVWKDRNHYDDTSYLYVYSLSSNSWDQEDFYAPKTNIIFSGCPTYMGRCMHWVAQKYFNGMGSSCSYATEIVVYDVINGAKSWFHLPESSGYHHFTKQQTLVIEGCLSIVIYFDTDGDDVDAQESGIGVWVMEEYGVEGSWVKKYFIQGDFTQVRFPLVSRNDGEIVFNEESDDSKVLMFFDINSGKWRYVEFSSYHVAKFFKYVESLASV